MLQTHVLRLVDDAVFHVEFALDSLRPIVVSISRKPYHSEVPCKVATGFGALELILALPEFILGLRSSILRVLKVCCFVDFVLLNSFAIFLVLDQVFLREFCQVVELLLLWGLGRLS